MRLNIQVGDRLVGARGTYKVKSIKKGVIHVTSEESGLTWEFSVEEEPDAKARQGYIPSPTTRTCQNCAHLQSETVPVKTGWGEELEIQRLLRCGLGDFPVWSTATCNEHKAEGA